MKKSMALLAILCTIFFYSESLHASLSKNPSDVIPKGETLVYEVRCWRNDAQVPQLY